MSIFRISAAVFTGEAMWGLDWSKKEGAGAFFAGAPDAADGGVAALSDMLSPVSRVSGIV
jgi:hypothetical protein